MKPKVYDPPIPQTNASVQSGQGNAKNTGKHKARYPHKPLMPDQNIGSGPMKHRAYTPGGPSGS